jgi:peptide/nickel transport system substrate-binding protein
MSKRRGSMTRRNFLRSGAVLGIGASVGPLIFRKGWAASKERVTIFPTSVIDSLHPYNHSSSPMYGDWNHIIEPLIEYDYAKTEYTGVLAESWELEGKKWTFHLRKGIQFHNGAPFTSKDVVYSFTRIKKDKKSLQASNFKEVVEMQAPDDHTVVLVTKKPNAVLLNRLNNRFILSKAAADKLSDKLDQMPIGTGPYKFVSFERGGNLVMTRNDDYWGGKTDIQEVVFRKVTEAAARVAALESGQADIINNLPVHERSRVSGNSRLKVEKVSGLRLYFLAMNMAFKPFDNKLVRQALNHAIDPGSIVKNIFDDAGFVVDGPVAPWVIGSDPNLKRYPHDPEKAKKLLAEAGYPKGLTLQLYYSAGRYPKDTEVCQVLAAQMAKADIKLELISQEWAIFWGKEGVNGGKRPFYYIGRGTLMDADTLYDQYFRTGTTKRVNYSNPQLDQMIIDEQQIGDHKKRVEMLRQAGKVIMDEALFVPLYNLADLYATARSVTWKPRPDEKILASEMKIG